MPRKPIQEITNRKTANGLGSVDQLPSGLWRWRVSVRVAGKRIRVAGTAQTETAARKALNKAVTDAERGTLITADRVTFREYAKTWLEAQPDLRFNTRKDYTLGLKYANEVIGHMRLRDIRGTDLQTAMKNLAARDMGGVKDKKMSARTVNQVRARMKSVFQQAVIDQLLFVNPAVATKRVKDTRDPEDRPGQALEPVQVSRFVELGTALHAAGVSKLWSALFVMVSVGLRRGEALALRWSDIDLENRTLNVRHTLIQEKKKLVLGKPKTVQSIREIPLVSSEVAVLTAHLEASRQEAQAVGRAWSSLTPVFATLSGAHTEPRNLQATLKSLLAWSDPKCEREQPKLTTKKRAARAGTVSTLERKLHGFNPDHRAKVKAIVNAGEALPNIRLHDLRHTAGTMMLQRKMPVEIVSRILGHASISITLDVYRHVSQREIKLERIDVFDQPLPVRDVPALVVN